MTWIKICGITNLKDALAAAALEVEALGFIFAPSPRRIAPEAAREIIDCLPPSVCKVGVFVEEEISEVQRIAHFCGLNLIQFHGQEPPDYCREVSLPVIKAIRVKGPESVLEMEKYPFASILLDSYSPDCAGGTGGSFLWEWALGARKKRNFILSGGLTPGNVGRAIHLLRPQGVDSCSGVEWVPGKKDTMKVLDFVKEVRKADSSTR
jgi:phosphoribosylanthranilate isomerase